MDMNQPLSMYSSMLIVLMNAKSSFGDIFRESMLAITFSLGHRRTRPRVVSCVPPFISLLSVYRRKHTLFFAPQLFAQLWFWSSSLRGNADSRSGVTLSIVKYF